jgi:hypothetical protein
MTIFGVLSGAHYAVTHQCCGVIAAVAYDHSEALCVHHQPTDFAFGACCNLDSYRVQQQWQQLRRQHG